MEPTEVQVMSVQEIDAIAQKIVENKAATERGEPPPHVIPLEDMKRAIASIRQQSASRLADKPAAKGKAVVAQMDLSALGEL